MDGLNDRIVEQQVAFVISDIFPAKRRSQNQFWRDRKGHFANGFGRFHAVEAGHLPVDEDDVGLIMRIDGGLQFRQAGKAGR